MLIFRHPLRNAVRMKEIKMLTTERKSINGIMCCCRMRHSRAGTMAGAHGRIFVRSDRSRC